MQLDEYQKNADSTAVYPGKYTLEGLIYVTLGLGEAGEFQNKVKKILRDDNNILTEERRDALIDELGDILWYISQVSTELRINLSDVARLNNEKLARRRAENKIKGDGDYR